MAFGEPAGCGNSGRQPELDRCVGENLVLLRARLGLVVLVDVARIELFPMSSRGRIITRMKRLGRSAAACANTGSGPVSYQAPPGPYDVERPWVSMRMPPSIRQRMPGP